MGLVSHWGYLHWGLDPVGFEQTLFYRSWLEVEIAFGALALEPWRCFMHWDEEQKRKENENRGEKEKGPIWLADRGQKLGGSEFKSRDGPNLGLNSII